MFKDVVYAPIMPLRKLRRSNMITITEANVGKAMGDINRFFAHDNVSKLHGFKFEVIGHEQHIMPDGYKYTTDIEGDRQIPIYWPIPKACCTVHTLWTQHLSGEYSLSHDPNKIPRLSIHSIYQPNCIPVGIGDRYRIFGDRLVIYNKYDKFIHRTPWLRYTEFIRLGSVDKDAYLQQQIDGLHSTLYDEMYYTHESMYGRVSSPILQRTLEDILRSFSEQIGDFVDRETRTHGDLDEWQILELSDPDPDPEDAAAHTVTFRYNPYLFLKYGLSSEHECYKYVKYDDNDPEATSDSLIHATLRAYQNQINESNESYNSKHPLSSLDDDDDLWDW